MSYNLSYKPSADVNNIQIDDEILGRFSKAIQCETVSWSTTQSSPEELLKLHAIIKEGFPTIHSSPLVECEVINDFSLLFTVKGSDPSLKPYIIACHLDVVPVTGQTWEVEPFSGIVKDGFIWGRGTIDDKNGVMGSLEALEFLLKSGHSPKRSFLLAFGHDEEVSGRQGAAKISKELQSRNISVEFILDEGLMILNGILPGVRKPTAVIGVGEKGFLSLELRVDCPPGHSSAPPKTTSIGIVAKAVTRIEKTTMPVRFGRGPEAEMFKHFAPLMPYPLKTVASNRLFRPLLARMLSKQSTTNALVRTTVAVTEFHGGTKDNVIPATAKASLNIRIHHGDTADSILTRLSSRINDHRVQIKKLIEIPPSPIASSDSRSFGYNTIASSILDVFPNVAIAPGLMIGGTDSVNYCNLTGEIYRFAPTHIDAEDVSLIHGANERISVKNYEETINFYYRVMLNADESTLLRTRTYYT